jgi:hypothetical protein
VLGSDVLAPYGDADDLSRLRAWVERADRWTDVVDTLAYEDLVLILPSAA